ncbi:MAG: prepilin peptidase [Patescibacteria group bacterium]
MNNLFSFYTVIVGLIVGSFLSMLIPRLHTGEAGIFLGRSHCAKCKHILGAGNLIPVISFLIQRGKCSFCSGKISAIYPIIELSTALTFLSLSFQENFIINTILFSILLFIFFYDLLYKEIHDAVMIPGILFALISSAILGNFQSVALGAVIGISFFGFQWLISKGKWLGSGDIRIGAFMGLMLGWQLTLVAIMSAYLLGTIYSLYLLATKQASQKTAIPLGPFLSLGTALAFFYGNAIIDRYLNLMI